MVDDEVPEDDDVPERGPSLLENGLSPISEAVVYKRQNAAELRAWSHLKADPEAALARADRLDAEADLLSDISAYSPTPIVVGTGGEVVPDASRPRSFSDTLRDRPSAVAVDASRHRMSMTNSVGVAALALDAAETVQARNSLEKMLAHQFAAAHSAAMRLQTEGITLVDEFRKGGRRYPILTTEAAKLLNASARMMETSQRAAMTLHRLRHSGQQTVVVQHVHINEGGQAVVAGQVKGRDRARRTAPGGGKK